MIASHRFVLLTTSISAAFLLSACQPTAEDKPSAPVEEITSPVTETPHAQHESMTDDAIVESESVTDETQMTDMLKDYTRSMTQMHDEMMIGMGYNDPDTAFAKGMLGHIVGR